MTGIFLGDKVNEEEFFDHEGYVLWEIAHQEASAMQQNPGFVHLLGASLYRLRESDLALAKQLRVTFYHTRNWAMENLPTTNPFCQRYKGYIDFDYTVERRIDERGAGGMHVRKVRKPPKVAPRPFTEHVHPPGEGLVVRITRNDPAASNLWAESMKTSLEFAQEIHAGSEPSESRLPRPEGSLCLCGIKPKSRPACRTLACPWTR